MDPYGERYLLTGNFYKSLVISLYLKGPKKRASLHVPQKLCPYGNRHPFQNLLNISFGVPSKGVLLLRTPHHKVTTERDAPFLLPFCIHHSQSPVYQPPPPSRFQVPLGCKGVPMERDAFIQSPNVSSMVPSKGALPRGTLQ
jgi:hypothetical protein